MMKWNMDKKKVVFMGLILCILLFIGGYGILTFGDKKELIIEGNRIPIPKMEENMEVFDSRKEAVDALQEVRQSDAPSLYEKAYIDSMGYYDKELTDKGKKRMIDSVYELGVYRYQKLYKSQIMNQEPIATSDTIQTIQKKLEKKDTKEMEEKIKELALEQQLFFASNPKSMPSILVEGKGKKVIPVTVAGTQVLKTHDRLQMKLEKDITIDGKHFKRNTSVYGFVSFKPNRTLLSIDNIDHIPISLVAYDLQDGREGIYIKNSFREEARREVLGDVVEDVNIAGIPQVKGIKRIFQRSNRQVKVMIYNSYQLLLKPKNN